MCYSFARLMYRQSGFPATAAHLGHVRVPAGEVGSRRLDASEDNDHGRESQPEYILHPVLAGNATHPNPEWARS